MNIYLLCAVTSTLVLSQYAEAFDVGSIPSSKKASKTESLNPELRENLYKDQTSIGGQPIYNVEGPVDSDSVEELSGGYDDEVIRTDSAGDGS